MNIKFAPNRYPTDEEIEAFERSLWTAEPYSSYVRDVLFYGHTNTAVPMHAGHPRADKRNRRLGRE